MKLVFENGWDYDIKAIYFEVDERNNPVDIVIAADEETLMSLTDLCMIGYNIREMQPEDKFFGMASHIALYARLYPFRVVSEKEYRNVF